MRTAYVVLALSLMLPPSVQGASNPCWIPPDAHVLSGSQRTDSFWFEYLSFFGSNSQPDYIFGRCVYNHHTRPLWINWRELGLKGVAKSNDHISTLFSTEQDDNLTSISTLYYGAAPDKITPEAIYRPVELALQINKPNQPLHNSGNSIALAEALGSFNSFMEAVKMQESQSVSLSTRAQARIALPINESAFERLMSGKDEEDEIDSFFYAVEINIGQVFTPIDTTTLEVESYAVINVSKRDLSIFLNAEPLNVNLAETDAIFFEKFLELERNFRLNAYSDFSQLGNIKQIAFPVQLEQADIVLDFGRFGRIELSLIFAVD